MYFTVTSYTCSTSRVLIFTPCQLCFNLNQIRLQYERHYLTQTHPMFSVRHRDVIHSRVLINVVFFAGAVSGCIVSWVELSQLVKLLVYTNDSGWSPCHVTTLTVSPPSPTPPTHGPAAVLNSLNKPNIYLPNVVIKAAFMQKGHDIGSCLNQPVSHARF